jgi:peptidoglycan/LPS O-acetylase OafA/YrhL
VRSLAAVVGGWTVGVVGYQIVAIVALLSVHGIPLGSAGGPPGPAYFAVNLTLSALVAAAAGWTAARIARAHPTAHGAVAGGALAALALWGFTRPASHWPGWYAPVLAWIAVAGCMAGAAARRGRTQSGPVGGRDRSPPQHR